MLAYAIVPLALAVHVVLRELARRKRTRLVAFVAGNVTGYLVTAAMALVLYECHGVAGDHMVVAETKAGYDAVGKLQPGDWIQQADGYTTNDTKELSRVVKASNGAPVEITYERDRTRASVSIAPRKNADGVWLLGVQQEQVVETPSVGTALGQALAYPAVQIATIMNGIAQGVRDAILGNPDSDPGGPTRIVAEYRRRDTSTPALKLAMILSAYLMLAMLIADFVRAVLARKSASRS